MQNPSHRRLPEPVGHLLSLLPARPGSWLFSRTLNLLLVQHLDADLRRALEGKRLRLTVTDARLAFDFQWRGQRFEASGAGREADLNISATLHDLGLLAARKADPDTLFFSRRLVMEGDTELGLHIKNALDAIDATPFNPARLAPSQLLNRLRPHPRDAASAKH
jgi:predicted lipid carrier protein YhbT